MPDETTEFVDFLEKVEEMYPAWVLWNHESHVNTLKDAYQLYDIKRSPYEEMLVAKTSAARQQADTMRRYTPQVAERMRHVTPRLYLAIFFSRHDQMVAPCSTRVDAKILSFSTIHPIRHSLFAFR